MAHQYDPPIETLLARFPVDFPNLQFMGDVARGGMGIVFRMHQTTLDRAAALKVLLPADGADSVDYGPFFAEVRSLAKLNVPGIVGIYDAGQTVSGTLYMLLEWMPGGNLRRLLAKGRLSHQQVIGIAKSLGDTLQQAHALKIVHGDIKPDNILLDAEQQPHLSDFGVASLIGKRAQFHTPEYAAPELLGEEPRLSPQTDLFALGVTLAELLLGKVPATLPADLAKQLADVPQPLKGLLLSLLDPSPQKRPAQAADIAKLLAATPVSATKQPSKKPVRILGSKQTDAAPQKFPILPLVTGAIALAACAVIFWPSSTPEQAPAAAATGAPAKPPESSENLDAVFAEANLTPKPTEPAAPPVIAALPPTVAPPPPPPEQVAPTPPVKPIEMPPPPTVSTAGTATAEPLSTKDARRGWHPGVETMVSKYIAAMDRLAGQSPALADSIAQQKVTLAAGGLTPVDSSAPAELQKLQTILLAGVEKALREDCFLRPENIPADAKFRDGTWHKVFPELISWHKATLDAMRLGGHLEPARSRKAADAIIAQAGPGQPVWLGGSKNSMVGNWHWITGDPITEPIWLPPQPDNAGKREHVLELSTSGAFNDFHPDAAHAWAVEWSPLIWHLKATSGTATQAASPNQKEADWIVDGGSNTRTVSIDFQLPSTAAFLKNRLRSACLIVKVNVHPQAGSAAPVTVKLGNSPAGQWKNSTPGHQSWIPLQTGVLEPTNGMLRFTLTMLGSDGVHIQNAESQDPPVLLLQFSETTQTPLTAAKSPANATNTPVVNRCKKCDGFGNGLTRTANGISKRIPCRHCGGDGIL